ncbi:light-harvesting protein [Maritalea mobilis]|uniref:light-harvesting protein n=1 Tax=Maritalea mobilis TaxID=483324 RepID=UPI001C952F50|nr:light-harvesting protein [Maritalea mobilis]
MNNAKLWLVVKPTVGIPVFLGAVAVGSFAVHVAVLSHTTWYNDYLTGQPLGSGAAAVTAEAALVAPEAETASYAAALDQGTLPDDVLASASVTAPLVE